jgi:tripartite-type tricarboxylate transporter receptor subunit TctC
MLKKLLAVTAICLLPVTAQAQNWPQRPITLIHGFGAGGNADSVARLLGATLAETLGTTVVVDAKPGAGGNIASEFVTRATPDGYTLILLTGGHAVSSALNKKLRYDPIGGFSFVSLIGTFPFVVATRADSPITDLKSLVAAAKKDPGKLTFSSVGFGSTQHLTGELLALSAGIKLTHVPYRGGMQPLTDLIGGTIDLIVDTITVTGPAVQAGTLKGLGVSSSKTWPTLPQVAPIANELPGFEVKSWVGLAAPAGTPPDIVAKLNDAVAKAAADPAFQAKLTLLGIQAEASTSANMAAFVASESKRWNDVIDRAGIERAQ